jgi:hypothetical protein
MGRPPSGSSKVKAAAFEVIHRKKIYDGQREVSLAKQGIALAITEIDDVGVERERHGGVE